MSQEYYIGDILMFGAGWVPVDFMPCDGRQLLINGHQELFSLIGTTYGGDGRTRFALPDMRGRTVFGYSPEHPTEPMGTTGGSENVHLTDANLPNHNHNADTDFTFWQDASTDDANVGTPVPGVVLAKPTVPGLDTSFKMYSAVQTSANVTMHPLVVEANASVAVSEAGESAPINNMQPYLAIGYFICVNGAFPSRN